MFEKFNSLKSYELCPSHYLSAPSLSWDETTKIGFQFIPDPNMHISFEKCTRGRIFDISNRIAKSTINI